MSQFVRYFGPGYEGRRALVRLLLGVLLLCATVWN